MLWKIGNVPINNIRDNILRDSLPSFSLFTIHHPYTICLLDFGLFGFLNNTFQKTFLVFVNIVILYGHIFNYCPQLVTPTAFYIFFFTR